MDWTYFALFVILFAVFSIPAALGYLSGKSVERAGRGPRVHEIDPDSWSDYQAWKTLPRGGARTSIGRGVHDRFQALLDEISDKNAEIRRKGAELKEAVSLANNLQASVDVQRAIAAELREQIEDWERRSAEEPDENPETEAPDGPPEMPW